jgi:hypothetical protein
VISRRRDPTIQKILNVTALGFRKAAATSKNFRVSIKYWSAKFRRGSDAGSLAEQRTAEYRMTNDERWHRYAKSFIKQTEYIHSTFDVRCSSVSFSIRLAALQASGGAEPFNLEPLFFI